MLIRPTGGFEHMLHEQNVAILDSVDTAAMDREVLVATLVEQAALVSPDATALRDRQGAITYGELNARANRFAAQLRARNAGPDRLVAICLDRSFDQVASILAVMKVGAAFLPLDLAWPDKRICAVLDHSGAAMLIGEAGLGRRLPQHPVSLLIDRDAASIAASDPGNQPNWSTAADLAYVIYTSGSSGVPKGVEITQGNLANFVVWHRDALGITPADRSGYLAALGFDAAVWDIWPYLIAGASVSLVSDLARTSPELLQKWMIDEGITVAFVTTVLAEPMLTLQWPAETRLRLLLTGGDTLRTNPPAGLPFALVNCYGPTECTIIVTAGEVAPNDPVNPPAIGWPIASSRIHVLDEHGAALPAGQTGEITVGGPGVGRGYHGNPELTARLFVPDGFSDVPGARLYRTGDLGCVLPDGRIAFRGRIDQQVKIRGNRVEPEEVSQVLSGHGAVAVCVVVATGTPGVERRLIGYVVPAPNVAEPTGEELTAFLAGLLPSYLVPAAFVRLAALPINANGKLDRHALPDPEADNMFGQAATREPTTRIEQYLASLVCELLLVQQVGADDNFFALGGHSLLGTQVILRAREAFGVELSLRDLFEAQTVALLAATIERLLVEQIEAMSDEDALRQVTA